MTSPTDLATKLPEERKKFLHTIYTTALEGGIDYWCDIVSYRWSKPGTDFDNSGGLEDIDGFQATIEPPDMEGRWGAFSTDPAKDVSRLTIDLEVLERGAQLFLRYCHGLIDYSGQPVAVMGAKQLDPGHYWRQWLVAEATNGKEGDFDAEVADTIVQFGLFGRVVYA